MVTEIMKRLVSFIVPPYPADPGAWSNAGNS
jgi:hypothetical protein